MSTYFRKFKKALQQPEPAQSFGIIENIKEATTLVAKIRQLEADIRELKIWKDSNAIPTMDKNIEDIKVAISEIKAISNEAAQASAIAEKAASMANVSLGSANEALTKATDIYGKFQRAAAQLKVDTQSLGEASANLMKSLDIETALIKEQFINFGSNVYNSALQIGRNLEFTSKELQEAYNQIATPLSWVKEYARRARDDNIIFLPYNVYMSIYWGFLK